ncbi:MAG: hypothetical protein HWE21_01420 [Cytophagia bacterium]|nr:hypothetical protein [Cytophagia bacterium]
MNKITLSLTITFLLIYNLSIAQKSPIDVHGFNKTLQLEELLTPIDLQSEIFLIKRATSDDKHLFVFNDKESPVIKAYRLSDGKYVGGFGSMGQGPGEFDGFNRGAFNARKGQLVTQDRKYVRVYDVLDSNGQLEFEKIKEVRMPTELGIVNRGMLVNDDLYGGSIMLTEKDFVTFPLSEMSIEAHNQSVGSFGDYPQDYPEIPSTAYYHLYQGQTSYAYDGEALVRSYSRVPLMRLFSLPDGGYKDIRLKPKNRQIKNLEPDPRGRSIQNGIQMLSYFSGVKLGMSYIVAEYQESKFEKVEMSAMGNSQRVPLTDKFLLVFSREGDLLAKLSPPEWLEQYHVTPDNRLIVFHPEISDQLFMVDLNQFK